MFGKLIFSFLVVVTTSLSTAGLAEAAPKDKVTICHKPGTPAQQTLQVAKPALSGHLGHGDTQGPCGPPPPVDADGDGFVVDDDCNDNDASINPGATEVPYDGIDQNCDGQDLTDVDGDGYDGGEGGADCDDADVAINPGATDIPNDDIDQNCDGEDLIVGDGSVRVTLTWDSDDDVDLHVIDPNGFRIFYADKVAPSGGVLDRDDNVGFACGADPEPGGVENVFWPIAGAPSGTYTVEIHSYKDCAPAETNFTLQVFVGGNLVDTITGTAGGGGGAGPGSPGALMATTTFVVP